ncbi:MAG: glycosyltransferase [Bacteroidales bacterium]
MSLNTDIHALWIGNQLSFVELLTIKSFLKHGYKFNLWIYNPLVTEVPKGTCIRDASEIIPRHRVFKYKYANQFGHGKGSYAGFSDIFRYKLLYEHGGWWTDMDVTCLKPLGFEENYVFRTHHELPLVGNIMKVPKGSALMKDCYEEAARRIDENNRNWHLPIEILANNVEKHNLTSHIHEFTNPDSWDLIRKMLRDKQELPEHWKLIHWVNEEWRRNRISKLRCTESSLFANLLTRHNIHYKKARGYHKYRQLFRLSLPGYIFSRLRK